MFTGHEMVHFPHPRIRVHTKPFLIINELMHRPLPPSAVFHVPRVMSACHQGKINIIAGIIAFVTHSRVLDLFIV